MKIVSLIVILISPLLFFAQGFTNCYISLPGKASYGEFDKAYMMRGVDKKSIVQIDGQSVTSGTENIRYQSKYEYYQPQTHDTLIKISIPYGAYNISYKPYMKAIIKDEEFSIICYDNMGVIHKKNEDGSFKIKAIVSKDKKRLKKAKAKNVHQTLTTFYTSKNYVNFEKERKLLVQLMDSPIPLHFEEHFEALSSAKEYPEGLKSYVGQQLTFFPFVQLNELHQYTPPPYGINKEDFKVVMKQGESGNYTIKASNFLGSIFDPINSFEQDLCPVPMASDNPVIFCFRPNNKSQTQTCQNNNDYSLSSFLAHRNIDFPVANPITSSVWVGSAARKYASGKKISVLGNNWLIFPMNGVLFVYQNNKIMGYISTEQKDLSMEQVKRKLLTRMKEFISNNPYIILD